MIWYTYLKICLAHLQPRKHFQAFGTTYSVQDGYSLHKELGQGAYGTFILINF